MEDTTVKLSVDLSSRVLQQFNKFSHKANITIDIGPNLMLAVKYLAGSLILFKTIDAISSAFSRDNKKSSSSSSNSKATKEEKARNSPKVIKQ
ncbi:hypothetical protein MUCCIDRAFT_115292 [Mucor lusitanicus CBS 277.49]|uniref:Uncharacterized protein n=1 Tax=Mucor lusitanicus CBS 277.49 TaxID=747725 RepID=A0A168H557_MUCCL|nr:hypothetical protein MUCCIDRAFT_115292 [Mucor lusitanicus CBS 277.49]